ncbi:hypothetical protein EYF80_055767 [Liparis tanakae]|uniref:Uncharacterized protein n=1 Tax=Liparis tanakae TaxID=230148 RepID=A0A4Z2EYM0_9TELE|nr:hypothetical protein EYF80_055767 [Liparis tanakae]
MKPTRGGQNRGHWVSVTRPVPSGHRPSSLPSGYNFPSMQLFHDDIDRRLPKCIKIRRSGDG